MRTFPCDRWCKAARHSRAQTQAQTQAQAQAQMQTQHQAQSQRRRTEPEPRVDWFFFPLLAERSIYVNWYLKFEIMYHLP